MGNYGRLKILIIKAIIIRYKYIKANTNTDKNLGGIIFLGLFIKKDCTNLTLKAIEGKTILLNEKDKMMEITGIKMKNIPCRFNFKIEVNKKKVSKKYIANTTERKLKANK